MQIALRAVGPARRYRHRRIARVLRPAPDHRTPGPARAGSSLRARPGDEPGSPGICAGTSRRRARRGGHAVVSESAGCLHVRAAKRRLLKIVQRHGIALIEDDVFGDLGSAAERPPAVKAWDRDGRVIYCGSCSKSMAPGFRLGWVLGGRHQRQLESLKIGSSLAAPLLEQQVLADYMKSGRLPAHPPAADPAGAGRRLGARLRAAAFSPGHAGAGSRRRLVAVAGTAEPADTLALLRDAVSQASPTRPAPCSRPRASTVIACA